MALKCWAQFWSKFQTLKNQFEQGSGRCVVPEPALKMGPRNQAKTTKKKHEENVNNTKPNASFCRMEPFRTKKKLKMFFEWHWAVGFSVAKDL